MKVHNKSGPVVTPTDCIYILQRNLLTHIPRKSELELWDFEFTSDFEFSHCLRLVSGGEKNTQLESQTKECIKSTFQIVQVDWCYVRVERGSCVGCDSEGNII